MSTQDEKEEAEEETITDSADVPNAPTSSHDRAVEGEGDEEDWVVEEINGARVKVLRNKQLRRVLVG